MLPPELGLLNYSVIQAQAAKICKNKLGGDFFQSPSEKPIPFYISVTMTVYAIVTGLGSFIDKKARK